MTFEPGGQSGFVPGFVRLSRPVLPRDMSDTEIPESDRLGQFPHPREVSRLAGQEKAEQALFDAFMSGRMQHAWLLTGPKGIGKATLAYRMARFALH